MNYIVLDLEWNQTPNGKGTEKKGIPFEIIEIGAIKLNERLEVIGRFSELIRPQIYRKMHKITRQILQIDVEDLKGCRTFPKVAAGFLKWCGQNYRFCTWSSMDLTELQRNFKYYRINPGWQMPLYYYDLQRVYNLQYEEEHNMRSLESAVDKLGISKEMTFHRASEDAEYTVEIMKRLDIKLMKENVSVDYFMNPKNRREEILTVYRDHSEFVSMEFDTREAAMNDRKLRSTPCFVCRKKTHKKMHWFATNSGTYFCLAECPVHGLLLGRLRFKQTDEGKIFAIRTICSATEQDMKDLQAKKAFITKKRREHRKKEYDAVNENHKTR